MEHFTAVLPVEPKRLDLSFGFLREHSRQEVSVVVLACPGDTRTLDRAWVILYNFLVLVLE